MISRRHHSAKHPAGCQNARVANDYALLVDEGRRIANVPIGRPGRSRPYWWMFPIAQLLRLRYLIRVTGRQNVAPGPAILIGNHLSLLDPVLVGVANRFRIAFFTKIEVYERFGAFFFRWSGQIPLRRGDEESTRWSLRMGAQCVSDGCKLSIYPEGTRSSDGRTLHRLHRRVLVPVLHGNPDVPVHAVSIAYGKGPLWWKRVDLRFSPALALDLDAMSADEVTQSVTDALLELGGMPYDHAFSRITTRHRERSPASGR